MRSAWMTGTGPARRDYELTDGGLAALDEWAAVMKERPRLVAEFDGRYPEWVTDRRLRGLSPRGSLKGRRATVAAGCRARRGGSRKAATRSLPPVSMTPAQPEGFPATPRPATITGNHDQPAGV